MGPAAIQITPPGAAIDGRSRRQAVDNDKGEIRPDDAFAETEYFAVDEPEDDMARFDCYLDDIFGAFMEREAERGAAAIPLALHIVGRPHDPNRRESFPRDDIRDDVSIDLRV